MLKLVKIMLGDQAEKEIDKIPPSNNTNQRRIVDLSENIEERVIAKHQNNIFAQQIDESTDVNNHAMLIAYILFIDDDVMVNQFLCCKKFPTTTRGLDIFNILTEYFEKHGLSWDSNVGICMDGAPLMVGTIKVFASPVEKPNASIVRTHWFLYTYVVGRFGSRELHDRIGAIK